MRLRINEQEEARTAKALIDRSIEVLSDRRNANAHRYIPSRAVIVRLCVSGWPVGQWPALSQLVQLVLAVCRLQPPAYLREMLLNHGKLLPQRISFLGGGHRVLD
jgi:hypothetical protein